MRVLSLIFVFMVVAAALIPMSAAAVPVEKVSGEVLPVSITSPVTADSLTDTQEQSESAPVSVDDLADKEDGINLKAATTWIVIVVCLLFAAIISVTVMLGLRNRNNSK